MALVQVGALPSTSILLLTNVKAALAALGALGDELADVALIDPRVRVAFPGEGEPSFQFLSEFQADLELRMKGPVHMELAYLQTHLGGRAPGLFLSMPESST